MALSQKQIEARNVNSLKKGIQWFNEQNIDAYLATITPDFVWQHFQNFSDLFATDGRRGLHIVSPGSDAGPADRSP